MECLVIRKDKTVAYINKLHIYTPYKLTPRPEITNPKQKKLDEITEKEIISFYLCF